MTARQTLEERKMRCPKKSSVVATLLWVAVIFLGANAAMADLKVSFGMLPPVVTGETFSLPVTVTNTSTNTTITFNRVAAGYALSDMKIKGPYEVDTTPRSLAPGASTSFSFNFRISYGSGTIVPVAVIFAQDSYQGDNMRGGGIIGIKMNPTPPN
jgi:hypothetical protein